MNLRDLVVVGVNRLQAAGVEEARTKMEWLAAGLLNIQRDRIETFTLDEEDRDILALLEKGLERLAGHEPLQYVLESAPFLDLTFFVDRRVLIPRPETEELVTRVLFCPDLWKKDEVYVADAGTGSGCIAVALAVKRPQARVIGTDCSADALAIAMANASCFGVAGQVRFVETDLLACVAPATLDAVVSNPPYIASVLVDTLDRSVRDFEPRAALDGGADGLAVIRRLVDQALVALKNGGRVFLEIGDEQGAAVKALLDEAGFRQVAVLRDMYGQERFVEAMK
jgi:release factor glutamine methyltransferase